MQTLDALELQRLIREPVPEMAQIAPVGAERVLRQPLLDGEIVEINREVGDEERATLLDRKSVV